MRLIFILTMILACFETFETVEKKSKNQRKIHIKSLNCSSSGKNIAKGNLSCFHKNQERDFFVLEYDVISRVYDMLFNVVVLFKTTSKSENRVILNNTMDSCRFLNGTKGNVIDKWIFDQIDDYIPREYIHPCPYYGHLKFNITPKAPKAGTGALYLMKGLYSLNIHGYNNYDENILSLNLDGKIA